MTSYAGRVALVTGASVGIGASIAEHLVKAGVIVVGVARRVHLIQALADRLAGERGRLIARKVDLTVESEILETFEWIERELGGVDVLINNAALSLHKSLQTQTTEELRYTNDLNYMAILIASREFINGLMRREIKDGVIVNVNSIVSQFIPYRAEVSLGSYPSTKSAMTAICTLLRHDMKNAELPVRITNLSPGAVRTEMITDLCEKDVTRVLLECDDIALAVNFVLGLPKHVEITELTIRPTGEVF